MSNKTKLLVGIVGAAAAGVIVGLLLAPEKGADIRKNIGRKATDWTDHLTDLFANAKGEFENLRKKGKGAASDAADRVQDARESYS